MKLPGIVRSRVVATSLGARRVRATRLRPLDFAPFDDALAAVSPGRRDEIDALLASATPAEGAVAGIHRALADGAVTAEELALQFLGRLRRGDEALSTMIALDPGVLAQARAADARRRAGTTVGPLDGIPVTLKDNIETEGPVRTTAGAILLADHVAAQDAPVATALRAAGAVILGKTNLSELAGAVARTPGVSAVGGETVNPNGLAFSPGGSSSGSAAGVAAGLSVLSVGTETSGSLIAPASFNGVVAIKPTHGSVPAGIVPLVRDQDTTGAVGPSVADAAALLAAMGGAEAVVDPASAVDALRGVRVGVLVEDIVEYRSPYESTRDNEALPGRIELRLRAAGAEGVAALVVTPARWKQFTRTFAKVVFGGLAHDTVGYLAAAGAPVSTLDELRRFNLADPRVRMPRGQFFVDIACFFAVGADEYETLAAEHRRDAAEILDATFVAAAADVLVSVSAAHSPLYACAGYPAVTVPLGRRSDGMPVGATLIGRRDDDVALIRYAYAFEQAANPRP